MMEDEHDLYGDIDETPVFSFSATGGTNAEDKDDDQKSRRRSTHAPMSLVEENKFLREKVAKVQGENDLLKRNMGTLFRTATAEIQRKDKEILRLAAELDKVAVAGKSERG
eukprot:scaffold1424_cov168-Amphora_coffeaeformis.AAC.20